MMPRDRIVEILDKVSAEVFTRNSSAFALISDASTAYVIGKLNREMNDSAADALIAEGDQWYKVEPGKDFVDAYVDEDCYADFLNKIRALGYEICKSQPPPL